jgi:hypothetical protein
LLFFLNAFAGQAYMLAVGADIIHPKKDILHGCVRAMQKGSITVAYTVTSPVMCHTDPDFCFPGKHRMAEHRQSKKQTHRHSVKQP